MRFRAIRPTVRFRIIERERERESKKKRDGHSCVGMWQIAEDWKGTVGEGGRRLREGRSGERIDREGRGAVRRARRMPVRQYEGATRRAVAQSEVEGKRGGR